MKKKFSKIRKYQHHSTSGVARFPVVLNNI